MLKDERSVIEELVTTNREYKKVNTFLVNEIEQLKQENEQLKVELLKLNMSSGRESMTSDSDMVAMNGSEKVRAIYDKYNLDSGVLTVSDQEEDKMAETELEFCDSACQASSSSSGNFGASNSASKYSNNNLTKILSSAPNGGSNRIDLSKYIDNESDDNTNDEDSDDSHNAPLEFTIDA